MKNTGKTTRAAVLLLVLCMISMVMLGGTFAKYTNEYAGSDTALVARWSFTGEFDDVALSGTSIDLPIWDHAVTQYVYEYNGTNYLIAPGIQGSFKVEFTYDADVDADLTFNFTKSGVGSTKVPIQYSLDNFTTIYYSLDDLENAIVAGNANITGSNGTYVVTDTSAGTSVAITKTVYWKWPYDVANHNTLTSATAGVAQKRNDAGFVGTGATIQYGGSNTAFKAWADADDVIAGNSSQAANRDSYVLNLQISATQKTPS